MYGIGFSYSSFETARNHADQTQRLRFMIDCSIPACNSLSPQPYSQSQSLPGRGQHSETTLCCKDDIWMKTSHIYLHLYLVLFQYRVKIVIEQKKLLPPNGKGRIFTNFQVKKDVTFCTHVLQLSSVDFRARVRICKPFKEPRNLYPAWRNGFLRINSWAPENLQMIVSFVCNITVQYQVLPPIVWSRGPIQYPPTGKTINYFVRNRFRTY